MIKHEYNPTVSFWVHPAENLKDRVYWERDPKTGKMKPKAKAPRTYEKAAAEGKSHAIFEHRKLKEIILDLIPNIKYPVKGVEGSMFFFLDDTEVYHNKEDMIARGTYFSIGICGIDLDNMPEELASLINSHFSSYVALMPQLVASYISNSKEGVHIVVRCREGLDHKQYVLQTILQTLRLVDVIKEVDGIDLTEYIDVSGTQMSQRHFTALCKTPQWNDFAEDSYIEVPEKCPIEGYSEAAEKVRKKWKAQLSSRYDTDAYEMIREFAPELFEDQDTYEIEKVSAPVDPDIYIDYEYRWLVWIALSKLFGKEEKFQKEVNRVSEILARNSVRVGKNHDKYYFIEEAKRSLKETKKAYSFPYKNLYLLGYSVKNTRISKVEKEVEEAAAEEIDKRKVMVEARMHWISRIQPSSSKIKLQGRYISDTEIPIIENTIRDNTRVTLKAPTGTGKTTTIKRIANEHDAIVLAPFTVLVDEYASDLKVIKEEKEYKGTACCMTYDRFVIMGPHNFRDKWIFIDEAHVLFMHRTYREKLVQLFNHLDQLTANGCHLIFVSATPVFTQGTKLLEFYQDRPVIRVFPIYMKCKDSKHGRRSENLIKKRIIDQGGLDEIYDRIVIFSDNSTRRLYDSTVFVKRDKVGIMHRDYPEECKKITEDNKLKAKYTMCTSIAYNGVNFTNEGEYVAVISIVESTTTAWNVIQQAGRVRNSIVDIYLVYDCDSESEKLSIDQKVTLNNLRTEMGLNSKVLWDDQVEADKQVEEYINANSDIHKIMSDMINEEYFFFRGPIFVELDADKKENPLRRAVDRYIKENLSRQMIESFSAPEFEKEIMKKYYKESLKAVNNIIDGEYILRIEDVADLFKYTGSKSIKSVVLDLKAIKNAISYSDDKIKEIEIQYKLLQKTQTDKIILKQIRSQLNEIEKLHEKYSGCVTDQDIVAIYKAEQSEKREKQKNGNSNGGKKGTKIKVTINGSSTEFNSAKDAAEYICCRRQRLYNALKTGKAINGYTVEKI